MIPLLPLQLMLRATVGFNETLFQVEDEAFMFGFWCRTKKLRAPPVPLKYKAEVGERGEI